jgi:hypothetical protein
MLGGIKVPEFLNAPPYKSEERKQKEVSDETAAQDAFETVDEKEDESFYENHCSLVNTVHKDLYDKKYFKCVKLPHNTAPAFEEYSSKYAAKRAVEEALREVYDAACDVFRTGSERCPLDTVAEYYHKILFRYFAAFGNQLQEFCEATDQLLVFREIQGILDGFKPAMKKELTRELEDDRDFYKMYKFDYFLDQIELEELDTRGYREGVLSIFEAVFTDSITYTAPDVITSIDEIERDVYERMKTFYRVAQSFYHQTLEALENELELLGKKLGPIQEEETVKEYLVRMLNTIKASEE